MRHISGLSFADASDFVELVALPRQFVVLNAGIAGLVIPVLMFAQSWGAIVFYVVDASLAILLGSLLYGIIAPFRSAHVRVKANIRRLPSASTS